MPQFNIILPTELKSRLIASALKHKCSLNIEVACVLLRRYRPEGWKETLAMMRARRTDKNPAVRVREGDDQQRISLILPDSLRRHIFEVAKKNYRSAGAEVRNALEGIKV